MDLLCSRNRLLRPKIDNLTYPVKKDISKKYKYPGIKFSSSEWVIGLGQYDQVFNHHSKNTKIVSEVTESMQKYPTTSPDKVPQLSYTQYAKLSYD